MPTLSDELSDVPLAVSMRHLRALSEAAIGRRSDMPGAKRIAAQGMAAKSGGGTTVAVPLRGTIWPRDGLVVDYFGGTPLDLFRGWMRDLATDPSVRRIVLDVDSPGGSVYGVQEAYDAVRAAASVKPVIAAVNPLAASAAYWIASAASEVVVTPGGEVGSIGVYQMHVDQSAAAAKAGYKVTYVSTGERKVAGHSYAPLDEVGREVIQGGVNDYYALFIQAVARGRRVSTAVARREFGQGATVRAEQAVRVGMADWIGTFDDVLAGRSRSSHAASPRQSRSIAELRSLLDSETKPQSPSRSQARSVAELRALLDGEAKPQSPSRSQATPAKLQRLEILPSQDAFTRVSFHEAGHGVAAVVLNVSFSSLSVIPDTTSNGRLTHSRTTAASSPRDLAVMSYAGLVGENLLGKRTDGLKGHGRDFSMAAEWLPSLEARVAALHDAELLIGRHKGAVVRVAERLRVEKTLDPDTVRKLVKQ